MNHDVSIVNITSRLLHRWTMIHPSSTWQVVFYTGEPRCVHRQHDKSSFTQVNHDAPIANITSRLFFTGEPRCPHRQHNKSSFTQVNHDAPIANITQVNHDASIFNITSRLLHRWTTMPISSTWQVVFYTGEPRCPHRQHNKSSFTHVNHDAPIANITGRLLHRWTTMPPLPT